MGWQAAGTEAAEGKEAALDELEEDGSAEHRAVLKGAEFKILSQDGEQLFSFDLVSRAAPRNGTDFFLRMPRHTLAMSSELSSLDFLDDDTPHCALVRAFLSGILPDRIMGRSKASAELGPTQEDSPLRYWPLPSFMDEALSDLRSAMSTGKVVYLGPLRAPAKRYYSSQSDINFQSDSTGELLPQLLLNRLGTMVMHAEPITHLFKRTRLVDALNSWLFFLRTGENYKSPIIVDREFKLGSMQDVLVELESGA